MLTFICFAHIQRQQRQTENVSSTSIFHYCKKMYWSLKHTYPSPGKLLANEIHFICKNQTRNFFKNFCFDAVSSGPGKTSCITGTRFFNLNSTNVGKQVQSFNWTAINVKTFWDRGPWLLTSSAEIPDTLFVWLNYPGIHRYKNNNNKQWNKMYVFIPSQVNNNITTFF